MTAVLFLVGGFVHGAHPKAHRIELRGASFDPLVDGEPAVPAALRAKGESAYALLQLADDAGQADLAALRAAGVRFHDPISCLARRIGACP